MSASPRIPVYRSALLAAATILFCVTSGLSYYSGNRIAATVGDRYQSAVEQVAYWISFVAQPWVFIATCIEAVLGIFVLYQSIASTVVTSVISACVLFSILMMVFRRWSSWLVPTVVCLCILAGVSIYTFKIDMKMLTKENSNYEGP